MMKICCVTDMIKIHCATVHYKDSLCSDMMKIRCVTDAIKFHCVLT